MGRSDQEVRREQEPTLGMADEILGLLFCRECGDTVGTEYAHSTYVNEGLHVQNHDSTWTCRQCMNDLQYNALAQWKPGFSVPAAVQRPYDTYEEEDIDY